MSYKNPNAKIKHVKVGDRNYVNKRMAKLANARIDAANAESKRIAKEKRERKVRIANGSNAGAVRGTAYGKEAQKFGERRIRGNYFSDYVMDNVSVKAKYERYVNGKQRIDAFAVVDGVAHIVEFKTGGVYPKEHMKQVLGYAKGLRNEGYSKIKITILYSDNRWSNKSWNVNLKRLDRDYNKVK